MIRPVRSGSPPAGMVGRVFTLLDAFSAEAPELTLTELVQRTGLPRSTAHRLIVELERWGALERRGTQLRPGLHLFELGQLARPPALLREAALPFMEDLYEATHHTVHLGVLDGPDVLYVERLTGRRGPRVPSRIGGRNPAHCTAVGKAMLAFLPGDQLRLLLAAPLASRTPSTITDPGQLRQELRQVVHEGAAYDQQEAQLGIACVAAPVLDRRRRPVAALSVAGPVDDINPTRLTPAVRTAALGLARVLDRAVT